MLLLLLLLLSSFRAAIASTLGRSLGAPKCARANAISAAANLGKLWRVAREQERAANQAPASRAEQQHEEAARHLWLGHYCAISRALCLDNSIALFMNKMKMSSAGAKESAAAAAREGKSLGGGKTAASPPDGQNVQTI